MSYMPSVGMFKTKSSPDELPLLPLAVWYLVLVLSCLLNKSVGGVNLLSVESLYRHR